MARLAQGRQPIAIAAVDDDRMLLDGLASWLKSASDLILTGTAATVDELLAGPGANASVVLLDLRLRDGSDPAGNVARLAAVGMRVLVVSVVDRYDAVAAAFQAGAGGYLTKDHDLPSLERAVRDIAEGGTVVSPELAFSLIRDRRPERPRLSRQEVAVLTAYASGMTLRGAAHRAGVKVGTAKEYLDRIKAKYSAAGRPAHTKIDLARRAEEDGFSGTKDTDP
jgi:two-component system, NarL family, nitrate/nitrite response regulator NarL